MVSLIPYSPEFESTLAGFVVSFWNVHHSNVSIDEARHTLTEWTAEDHSLFVILLDHAAVGFIRTHNTSPTVCWIDDLYVDVPYRGRGIATEAIRQTEAALRKRGCRSFCMEVVPDNLPAVRLYHRLGYDRLSLITMRKDDESFENERIENIAGLPLRVRKFN